MVGKLLSVLGDKNGIKILHPGIIDKLMQKDKTKQAEIQAIGLRTRDVLYLCFNTKNIEGLDQQVDDQEEKNIICKLFFQGSL